MHKLHALRYLSFLTVPFTVWIGFTQRGPWIFLPLLYVFGLIPLIELFTKPRVKPSLKPREESLGEAGEKDLYGSPLYDWILYLALPVQYGFLAYFCFAVSDPTLLAYERVGRVLDMGILCGILGINVAHELGHRHRRHEQWMAKSLLLTSLYTHFFIEHNRGHHKNVATHDDPASARLGESLYAFWLRSIPQSYVSAFRLEALRLRKRGLSPFSFRNEMLQLQGLQLAYVLTIGWFFGPVVAWLVVCAACFGFLLLETVNYIEHYGLERKQLPNGHYERVLPVHSWNSDHLVGRVMLFELSRHSDHHFQASRKYQMLRHHPHSPQMPTGYPGMMLLALVPPLWFYVMHHQPALAAEAQT